MYATTNGTTANTKRVTGAESRTIPVRVVGNPLPGYLLGRPRTFWKDVFSSKRTAAVSAPMFTFDEFDLAEIMDELHYGTDCEWAA